MGNIIEIARDLAAVMQPLTGDRATGEITVTATGADVDIPRASYAIPIIDGKHRDDLVFKVGDGPNDDHSWTVTSGGTNVDFLSNIGGARHNLGDGTVFVFDPPISGISTLAADGAFANGTDPTFFGAVKDIIQHEQLWGAEPNVDLNRSNLKGMPGIVITWQDTTFKGLVARAKVSTLERYTISVISTRLESDHKRRQEGQTILGNVAALLLDRKEVDGYVFSGPDGVSLERGGREVGDNKNYQRFYIYYLVITTNNVLTQRDTRTYSDWETAVMDVEKPQSPALPNQGDYTIVDDNEIDMT